MVFDHMILDMVDGKPRDIQRGVGVGVDTDERVGHLVLTHIRTFLTQVEDRHAGRVESRVDVGPEQGTRPLCVHASTLVEAQIAIFREQDDLFSAGVADMCLDFDIIFGQQRQGHRPTLGTRCVSICDGDDSAHVSSSFGGFCQRQRVTGG